MGSMFRGCVNDKVEADAFSHIKADLATVVLASVSQSRQHKRQAQTFYSILLSVDQIYIHMIY